MAKKKNKIRTTTTAIVPVRAAAPVARVAPTQIVVRTPAAGGSLTKKKKGSSVRRSSGGSGRSAGFLGLPADATAALAAGAVVGILKKTGIMEQIPRLPYVGRIGAAAIAAHLISKQTGSGVVKDVRNALAVLAAFQLTSSDKPWSERIEGGAEYPSDLDAVI